LIWRLSELLGKDDPETFFQSLSPQEFDQYKARHEVLPYDHVPKMLGLIAFMIAQYLGHDGISQELCMPWIDQTRRPIKPRKER
jgi:hypothetical protein